MKTEKINQKYKELADNRGWMLDTIYNACGKSIKEVFGENTSSELNKLEKRESRIVKSIKSKK